MTAINEKESEGSILGDDNYREEEEEEEEEEEQEEAEAEAETTTLPVILSNEADHNTAAITASVKQQQEHTQQQDTMHVSTDNSEEGEENQASTSSSLGLGLCQLRALLIKHALVKVRTPWSTALEILTPVGMMLILVAAFSLSDVTVRSARTYDTVQFDANVLSDLMQSAITDWTPDQEQRRILDATTTTTTIDPNHSDEAWQVDIDMDKGHDIYESVMTMKGFGVWQLPLQFDGENQHINPSSSFNRQNSHRQTKEEEEKIDDEEENDEVYDDDLPLDGNEDDNPSRSVYEVLATVQRQIRQILRNPLFVPSLVQYVTVSRAIQSVLNINELPRIWSDSSYGRKWGNLLTLGTLHLSPASSNVTRALGEYLQETYPLLFSADLNPLQDNDNNNDKEDDSIVKLRWHDSEQDALVYINQHLEERTWALIDLTDWVPPNETDLLHEAHFKIRMNYTTLPNTNEIIDFVAIGLNTEYQQYYLSGYLTLQRTLNEFALTYFGDNCIDTAAQIADIWSMPMPTAAYSQNSFFLAVGYLLGLTIAMAFLYPVSRLIKSIVEEKETRMRETLYILGVQPWALWWSWFLSSLLLFFVISVLVTRTLASNVLMHSSSGYLFLWIGFFSTSCIGFCFTVAALFSKAKLAAIIGPMALFATLLPRFIFFGYNRYEATTAKRWASLLPATAFAFGADIVADYEYAEQGIHDWNASEGQYSFNTSIGFLVFDTLLYLFLGWYIEQIMPREYGVAKPIWFLVSPKYWCACLCPNTSSNVDDVDSAAASTEQRDPDSSSLTGDNESVTDRHLVPRIVLKNLVKKYSNSNAKAAVDHLNLTLYESQITTLLGHNGAGKTTTISLLTGLFPPTSGDAIIYGSSIVNNPKRARSSIGICPQLNVLFDRLTVFEHIRFFQQMKGVKASMSETKMAAEEVGLEEFFHTAAAALSGGNKRKLSVAIAFSGGPKCIILDEPTSGMDPNSRRHTWELLRRKRIGRTILLCTHFMDEAELLSDRIAVMKSGKLQCSGTPIFLKNRFCCGYNMTVVLEPMHHYSESSEEAANAPKLDSDTRKLVNDLLLLVNKYIPRATLKRIGGKEIRIGLPGGEEDAFPECFDAVEEARSRFGIGAYGVDNASLEEVFIRLAEDENDPPVTDEKSAGSHGRQLQHFQALSMHRQISVLIWKRLIIQRRDLKGTFFTVVVPAVLVGLVLLVLTISVPLAGPQIQMSPALFRNSNLGQTASTDVWIGGGIAYDSDNVVSSQLKMMNDYNSFESLIRGQYPHVNTFYDVNSTSSRLLSYSLLSSINDRDHKMRYGAVAFADIISLVIKFSSGGIEYDDDFIANFAKKIGSIDLLGVLMSPGRSSGGFTLNITVNSIFEQLYTETGLTDESTFDAPLLVNLINGAIESIFIQSGYNLAMFLENIRKIIFDELPSNTTLDNNFDGNLKVADLFSSIVNRSIDILDEIDFTAAYNDFLITISDTNYTFDVNLIRREISNIVAESTKVFGVSGNLSSPLLDFAGQFLDVAEKNIVSSAAPIVLAYGFAEIGAVLSIDDLDIDVTTLSSIRQFFDTLWGGNGQGDKGYLYMEIASVAYDPTTSQLTLHDLKLETGDGSLHLNTASLNMPLTELVESMRQRGSSTFEIREKSSILHNASSPHAAAAFNQAYTETLLKQCSQDTKARLISINHPLPLTVQQSVEIRTILSVLASMFILIPYCYIPGAFVVFLVRERISKAKHLQLVSGVSIFSYWLANYLYDAFLYTLLTLLVMCIFLIYGKESAQVFVGDAESTLCTGLLTLGYGLSVLPFAYLIARRFENHSSAQIAVIGLVLITGFVAVNAYFIMSSIEKTQDLAETLRVGFRSWPAYNVGDGFIMMASAYWEREILGTDKRPLDWDVAGKSITLLYGLIVPYFAILLVMEYAQDGGAGGVFGASLRSIRDGLERMILHCQGVRKKENMWCLIDGLDSESVSLDDDVAIEVQKVKEHFSDLKLSAPVVINDMWKVFPASVGIFGNLMQNFKQLCSCCSMNVWCCFCGRVYKRSEKQAKQKYQPKIAVRGVSYALEKGETFFLLGNNGAGKSTTMNVITGDVPATHGSIFVSGSDITGREHLNGLTEARQKIGYCPQIDPLLELMTTRETLTMFARFRGIPTHSVESAVDNLLQRLTLTPHAEKTTESLSGGNKRKLSLGIALIGDPELLLIDESSSGLDPLAKRKLWSLISHMSKGKTVMSTTHNMEEAEALGTRVGIMANGTLLCLGSVQALKSKFLDGYTVDVFCKCETSSKEIDAVADYVVKHILVGSRLIERHGRFLRFDVPSLSSTGLGATFRRMEAMKKGDGEECKVESYGIQQCTLEQVFVKLVNQATGKVGDDTLLSGASTTGNV